MSTTSERQAHGAVKPYASWSAIDWALTVGLALLGFSTIASVAGVNIAKAALLLVAVPLAPAIWRLAPWKDPVMKTGLVLLAYIMLHTLWFSGFSVPTRQTLNHYQELLAAPLLMALMMLAPDRRVFYRAVMVGAVALAIAHWVSLLVPQAGMLLGTRRISAGFSLAVCAYLLLVQAQTAKRPWQLRALALGLALTVLFAIGSRTGYIVLVVLMGAAAWQYSPRRWRWAAALAVPGLIIVVALSSKEFQVRLHETMNVATVESSPAAIDSTSTAIRVHMLRLAGDMLQDHALEGVGFAGYTAAHRAAFLARQAREPALYAHVPEVWTRSTNPHNEYLMQLLGGGIAALGLYLAWLAVTLRQAVRRTGTARAMLTGLCLAFIVGGVFNSLLLDFTEGHFYIALLAWLAAEAARARPGSACSGS